MATEYYVDTTFEEEEAPASAKMNSFNDRIRAGFQLISNAFVDMTGDDKVIDDVGRTDELKVTASSPEDMTVHVAIGLACVDGQICQVDAPVDRTIVAPTTNPRYTIIQLTEEGEVETKDGAEAASPSEPDADADAMKVAAIYLRVNSTKIYDTDQASDAYIIDRRQWPTVTLGTGGNVGINTTGPDARLDVLETSGAQLRLTHTDGTKFVDFTLDTNHDLTIKPSSTGQIKLQATTDSIDFFQILDADGGTPVLNIDSDNERVGIKNGAPTYDLDVTGKARISNTLGVGIPPSDSMGMRSVLTGAGIQMVLGLGNQQDYAAGVGVQLLFQIGSGLSTMATINGVCAGATNDDGYMTLSTRKTDVIYERVRITQDGYVGVNTTGPDSRLDILDDTSAQLRLTQADGTVYTEFQTDGSGDLTITPSGDEVVISGGDILADGGFKQPFCFTELDVAASQSAVEMQIQGTPDTSNINTYYVMPFAGSVIGISVASNAARTAGTLTVDATVNATATGLQAQLDGTNTQYHSATQSKDTDTFSAGDRIGVKITTDAAWLPTTADIVVAVVIEM